MSLSQSDYVLAVLSSADGQAWTPVQVQKIFFLLDRKIPGAIEGPRWSFSAYDYGPFDAGVYSAIESLAEEGQAIVERPTGGSMRTFRLTASGQARGRWALEQLPGAAEAYIHALATWVRSLTFKQLVSAVYQEFPEMRERSVFRG